MKALRRHTLYLQVREAFFLHSARAIFEIMVTTDNYFEISLEVSWENSIFADIKSEDYDCYCIET
jgi:hypothetical protein